MKSVVRDNLKLAIGAILAACLAHSLGDALVKKYSATFLLWQIFFVRSAIAVPFLVYLVRLRGCDLSLMPAHFGWTLLRSLILVLMWVLYFTALPQIELAVAAAAYYTLPLFTVLFAAIFLGERIGRVTGFAALLGFVGTLLVLQPQAEDFNAYALLPVGAAICFAAAMIVTRAHCRHEKPTVLSLWLNITFVVVGAAALGLLQAFGPAPETAGLNPFLLGEWTPMGPGEWRIMAILAAAFVIASIGIAVAYQNGPASIVATFNFAYVLLAVIWGLLLFDEVPTAPVTAGIGLIVGAGLLLTWRRSV